ncbi:hypothetical protein CFT9_14768 [Pseudomonas sp. CFT9]|nr:hypothetical protein CFT9_14768 [Pseudomonas sp. CFT9]
MGVFKTRIGIWQFAVILAALSGRQWVFKLFCLQTKHRAVYKNQGRMMNQEQQANTRYNRTFWEDLKAFFFEYSSLFLVYLLFSMALIYWGTCLKPEVGELLNKAYGEGLAPISIAVLMVITCLIIGITRLIAPVSYAAKEHWLVIMALALTKFMISLMVTYYAYLWGFIAACRLLEFPVDIVLWKGAVIFPVFIFFIHWAAPRVFFDSFHSNVDLDIVLSLVTLGVGAIVVFVCLYQKPEESADEKQDVNSMVMCWYGRPIH